MTLFVINLVLCSGLMHAGWNLLARGQSRRIGERAFFGRLLFSFAVAGFVPAVVSETVAQPLSPAIWANVAAAGFCCAVYLFFLGKAYECSDFTVTYPLVRAMPVLLVAFADVLRARYPSAAGWAGMGLVVFGCFLVPLHSLKELNLHRYLEWSRLWMLLAGLGTVGYTVLNKLAAEQLQPGPASAARYGYMFFLATSLFFLLFFRLDPPGPVSGPPARRGWQAAFLGGVLMFAAYWLMLWAYQLCPQASYVVAFRQISIIVGVVVGFVLYKEKGLAVRVTGACMITAGLATIALWG